MNPEQMRSSAKHTAETRAFFEELKERFDEIYFRAQSEPDHPSLACSAGTPDNPVRSISGVAPLSEHEIIRLREEIPGKAKELADCFADGLVPVTFVKIYHDAKLATLEAHSFITYAQLNEDGKIDAEVYEDDPYYSGKERVIYAPHSVYPPEFIDDYQRLSMHSALDIVDQSVRTL